jgi:hypothetical protein
MSITDLLGLVVSFLVLCYLMFALVRGERL